MLRLSKKTKNKQFCLEIIFFVPLQAKYEEKMLPELSKIKGVHPGALLKREIKLRDMKNYEFADFIGEYPQTLSAILKGKRGINANLSIKLGEKLDVDKDYFMMLQASYDVKKADISNRDKVPNKEVFRRVLFWDADFDKIDWTNNRRAIIKRVFERGNELEINEIIRFYGKEAVCHELEGIMENMEDKRLFPIQENAKKFGLI